MTENKNSFVGYEYRDVTIPYDMEALYADSYPNFGWKLDRRISSRLSSIALKFKRDLQVPNKTELTNYQHQFDKSAREIVGLNQSKSTGANRAAWIIGIIGTVFMALSVFSMLANMLVFCVIFAVPAFIGWILPCFVHKAIKNKRSQKVSVLIEKQYDVIYDVCKQANMLLQG